MQNEISFDNFRAISRFAARAGGKTVRSGQDDRWLRATGPSAYQSIYDPSLGRLATSWWEVRPDLIMLYGEARPALPLSFPVRATNDVVGAFVGTNIELQPAGAGKTPEPNGPQTLLYPWNLPRGSETALDLSAAGPAFFFGVFGTREALANEFSVVRSLADLSSEGRGERAGGGIGLGPEVLRMILEMVRNPYQGRALDAFLLGKAFEILGHALHSADPANRLPRGELKKTPVRFICSELGRVPDEALSLADFARYLDVSERTLSRRFRIETGVTFSAYQRKKRMELAARLLATGTRTTQQIAGDVGYTAYTAFFRAFREEHGMTPDQYRRLQLH